jgi:subfamily B ATP-binding cassette protein MsbA
MRGYKLQFGLVLIGIICAVGATSATAYIMQPMMDKMFIARDEKMLLLIPLGLIFIYAVKGGGRYLQAVFTSYIGQHIITRIRYQLLEKLLFLDMRYIQSKRSGEMISRLTNDTNRIQYFVALLLPELIRESLTIVALIGYVFYLNASLAFYAVILLPVAILPLFKIGRKLKKYSHRSQAKNADIVVRLTEVFNNAEIIKANAKEEYELTRFQEDNWKFFKINMKTVYVGQVVSPILEILAASGLAVVIYMGGHAVYDGKMTVGEFTAFITAVGLVFQPARGLSIIYTKMQDAIAASERIFAVMELTNTIEDGEKELAGPVERIDFKDVDLFYEEKQVLKGVSFTAAQEQTIALVGDSGGGKSSVINVLLRFYDYAAGEVRLNGEEIRSFTFESLRKQVALVSQRVYVFQDTLAANVAYGDAIDEARVVRALKDADAWTFVESLDEGIYTVLEEFGANLSGGQRQRIAIARAIYKQASVLILDEATSALDNESEKRIQAALERFAKGRIIITIAHRLSTIEHADTILVFKQGEIVAHGTHTALLETSDEYRRLHSKAVAD